MVHAVTPVPLGQVVALDAELFALLVAVLGEQSVRRAARTSRSLGSLSSAARSFALARVSGLAGFLSRCSWRWTRLRLALSTDWVVSVALQVGVFLQRLLQPFLELFFSMLEVPRIDFGGLFVVRVD